MSGFARPKAPGSADPAMAFAPSAPAPFVARLTRCVVGLVICGIGISLIVAGDIGLAPWDVLHKGISRHTDLAVGSVIVIVGFALLVMWVPLRVRPGLGTILNAVLIGVTVNVALPHLPEPDNALLQLTEMAAGVAAFGLGTALYIGAGLGPGPRDGLMTGIAARGHSLRLVRTAIEVTVLGTGWLLGGSIGIGTAVFAFGIGPLVQFFLGVFGTRTSPALVAAD